MQSKLAGVIALREAEISTLKRNRHSDKKAVNLVSNSNCYQRPLFVSLILTLSYNSLSLKHLQHETEKVEKLEAEATNAMIAAKKMIARSEFREAKTVWAKQICTNSLGKTKNQLITVLLLKPMPCLNLVLILTD